MEENLSRRIDSLTRLIEEHKKKAAKEYIAQENGMDKRKVPSQMKLANVHINPNFKTRNPVILINPKIPIKPVIHVNPKIMKSANLNLNLTINDLKNASNSVQKISVHVNPNLMKKLSSAGKTGVPPPTCCASEQGTKTPAKKTNTNMVMLSRNKLVRIKCGSGVSPTTSTKMKTSFSTYHKLKNINKNSTVVNTPKIIHKVRNSKSYSPNNRNKINKYRLDKTKSLKVKPKKTETTERSNKDTVELIKIGGITYKSTRNQLIRRSYSFKKKRIENLNRNEKFLIASNGKKLCRVKSVIVSEKNAIRTKVKQKSIQILLNKMRKNNQPCLIFQKFGYCANEKNGSCHKLHDKKQISLCKKFLQGKCLSEQCLLSHDVGPEKMPTCKYFLEGCCTRDNCPYLHVKVSSRTPICLDFLKGYCAKGNECQKRHDKLCPEHQKTGKCRKGKNCPYPHKLSNLFPQLEDKYLGDPRDTMAETSKAHCNQENSLRYYTKNNPIDLQDKETKIMENCQKFQRPPIGTLPAYIPIN